MTSRGSLKILMNITSIDQLLEILTMHQIQTLRYPCSQRLTHEELRESMALQINTRSSRFQGVENSV